MCAQLNSCGHLNEAVNAEEVEGLAHFQMFPFKLYTMEVGSSQFFLCLLTWPQGATLGIRGRSRQVRSGGGKVFGPDLFLEWLFIYNLITLNVTVDNFEDYR